MSELYNKEIEKNEIMRYVGDPSQIADARESVLKSGRADGMRIIDVKTGSGLCFTVLPSRGMDLAWAEYKGIPLAFISKTGLVHPAFFEKDGLGFLRGFTFGLLTTCGLTYMGAPCTDEGTPLGLHGRISNIPADDVSIYKEWEGNDYVIRIRGKVRESSMFSENLTLTREITTKMGDKKIKIADTIENCGFDEQPFMILYHCNFGYPVVSEDTVLVEPETVVTVRDSEAEKGISDYNTFQEPTPAYNEQVFYHDINADKNNKSYACLYNKRVGIGAYIKFDREQFTHFVQLKMMGEGDYVVGLEPCNAKPEGRAKARDEGGLKYISPGETKRFELEIGVVETNQEIRDICKV